MQRRGVSIENVLKRYRFMYYHLLCEISAEWSFFIYVFLES